MSPKVQLLIEKIQQADSSLPLYQRICQSFEELILAGVLPDSYRLPSDRRLSELLGTTHLTLGKALNELRGRGLLTRKRGLGTFVNAPDKHAQSSPGSKQRLVALVFDHTHKDTFQSGLFLGLHKALQEAGLEILFLSSEGSAQTQFEQVKAVLGAQTCCACLVWSILESAQVRKLMQLKASGFPLIFLDKYYESAGHDAVVYDAFEGGFNLGQYFLRQGWRSFIFLARRSKMRFSSIRERLEGLKRCLAEQNLGPENLEVVLYDRISEVDPLEFMRKCQKAALISSFSIESMELLEWLEENEQNVLEITAHGVFSIDLNNSYPHKVTECCFSVENIAQEAVKLMLNRLHGDKGAWKIIKTKGELIEKNQPITSMHFTSQRN
ncbi:MAG: GntR family transcriptional regulator [Lentisphaeria bacterium]